MGNETTYDVFLSYNSLDRPAVAPIAEELEHESRQISCFLDQWYLQPGLDWVQALEQALAASHSAVLFLGPHGVGRWQKKERSWLLDHQTEDHRFPLIVVLLPGSEPPLGFLRQQMWVDLRNGSPTSEQLDAIAAAIKGKVLQNVGGKQPQAAICPYRGLLPFREEDAEFFFGRQKYIDDLVRKVDRHRLVAVVGSSGSGKSSVVRAGLVPRLRKNRQTIWEIATMVPKEEPLKSLLQALAPMLWPDVTDDVDLRERANVKAKSVADGNLTLTDLVELVLQHQKGTQRLLLVVDQWEELYTQCDDAAVRDKFIEQLLEATARDNSPFSVVLTMRSDFYNELLQNRPLLDRLENATLALGPMSPEELQAAIEQPAKEVGLTFQDGLVNVLLGAARDEPGRLALLEFALQELWKLQDRGRMTHAAYEVMGGLSGAIAKRAEDIYQKLSHAEQQVLPGLFCRLVRVGSKTSEDTRRRADFRSLDSISQRVVRRLADHDARLLVTSRDTIIETPAAEQSTGGHDDAAAAAPAVTETITEAGNTDHPSQDRTGESVEVAHEELLRRWGRLTGWIDEDRKFLQWRGRLAPLLEQFKRDPSAVLQSGALREARQFYRSRQATLENDEQKFVSASITSARNRKLVLGGAITAVVSIVTIVSVWVTLNQRVENLLAASPEGLEFTIQQLQLYRPLVVGRLHREWENDQREPLQRRQIACALARFGDVTDNELQYLLREIPNAKPEEYHNYVAAMRQTRDASVALLQLTADSDSLAAKRRYACLAIALESTGPAEMMAALDEDPSDRTELIHNLWTDWAPDLEVLLPLLTESKNDAFRSAICCALGRHIPNSPAEREQVVQVLAKLQQDAIGGGTHSAAGWALRQMRESAPIVLSKQDPPDRKWTVRDVGDCQMTFVLIPPGKLTIGEDETALEVEVSKEFWLSDREVTAALFAAVFPQAEVPDPNGISPPKTDSGSELPVFEVSWFDAVEFCNALSDLHDLNHYYQLEHVQRGEGDRIRNAVVHPRGNDGYRLPTEAEWEYACRAKSETMFCYGDDDLERPRLLREYAKFNATQAAICGSKLPNGWGLFDMHGNAYEWCEDLYGAFPAPGSHRVYRGGSCIDVAGYCRSAYRFRYTPDYRNYVLGFRLARSSVEPGQVKLAEPGAEAERPSPR